MASEFVEAKEKEVEGSWMMSKSVLNEDSNTLEVWRYARDKAQVVEVAREAGPRPLFPAR